MNKEACDNQLLFVGPMIPTVWEIQPPISHSSDFPFQFLQINQYSTAIKAIQHKTWGALLVADHFDAHEGIEFIQHARLLGCKQPMVLVCDPYDPCLDYKSHKIGASDCVPIQMITIPFLQELLFFQELQSERKRGPRLLLNFLPKRLGAYSTEKSLVIPSEHSAQRC